MQINTRTRFLISFFSCLTALVAIAKGPELGKGMPMHRFADSSDQDDSYGQMAEEGIIPVEFIGNERRIGPLKDLFKEKLPFKVFFSGYIKNALYWDTRQVQGFADDYTLLFPKARDLSICKRDINKPGQVDIIPLESRLIWYIFGPNIGEVRTRAKISTDFIESFEFTSEDEFFHQLRLREVYFVFAWKEIALLNGQAWHPMSYPVVAPNTVSFNTGSPMVPTSRNPQIRFMYYHNWFELWVTLLSQADFKNNGPNGFSTEYARNALVPNIAVLGKIHTSENTILGAAIDYQRLVPRLVTNKNFKTSEATNGVSVGVWGEFTPEPFKIYTKFTHTQNGQNLGIIGAYAVHCVNPITDRREYANLRTAAVWADVSVNKQIEPAFFIGYLKNLGANKTIIQEIINDDGTVEITNYTLFPRLDTIFRFSPRVRYHKDPFVFGAEIEYTRAVFGTPGPKGKIENPEPSVYNIRFVVDFSYFF